MMYCHRGFTLIELLIVMVIISVVSGIAVISLSNNQHRAIETVARQIQQQILLAEQEAMLRPATLGLLITHAEVRWYIYKETVARDESPWQLLTDRPFAKHRLMSNLEVSLSGPSMIVISMNGDLTPFTLLLGKKDQPPHVKLTGQANGGVKSELIDA